MNISGTWLLASMLIGTVGGGFFLYGKKQARAPQLIAGILLFADSSLVPDILWMSIGACAVLGLLWGALRVGV